MAINIYMYYKQSNICHLVQPYNVSYSSYFRRQKSAPLIPCEFHYTGTHTLFCFVCHARDWTKHRSRSFSLARSTVPVVRKQEIPASLNHMTFIKSAFVCQQPIAEVMLGEFHTIMWTQDNNSLSQ